MKEIDLEVPCLWLKNPPWSSTIHLIFGLTEQQHAEIVIVLLEIVSFNEEWAQALTEPPPLTQNLKILELSLEL